MKKFNLLLMATLLLATSCYDRREINHLEIVAGIGFDLSNDNQIEVSFQILNAGALGKNASGGLEPYWILQSKGKTTFDAIRKATYTSPNKLFFSHNQVIIISEDLAKQGIRGIMDLWLRDEEPREDTKMTICEGKAIDILKTKLPHGLIPAYEIVNMIEASIVAAYAPIITPIDHRRLTAANIPCTVFGKIVKTSETELEYKGGALVKDDKLVDYLTETETRGYLWLKCKIKDGLIIAKTKDSNIVITLEIIRAKSGFKPVLTKNGQLTFRARADITGRLGEFEDSKSIVDPTAWPGFIEALQETVKEEMRAAIAKATYNNLDFLGLNDSVRKYLPKTFKQLASSWEEIMPLIPFTFEINIQIIGVGMVKKSF